MRKISLSLLVTTVLAAGAISACSPTYDWRDYRSNDAPYAVLFPGKPVTQTRTVNLDGVSASMTMTAAEVEGTTFAVGSAELANAAQAQAGLAAMKTALIKNIGATVISDHVSAISSGKGSTGGQQTLVEIEAKGSHNGAPMLLIGHFIAKDKRIYQVIVMGQEKQVVRDTVDTFINSFKLN